MPNKFERRTLLKAMAGVPVLGALGFETLRKLKYDAKNNPRKEIVRELGLDDLLSSVKPVTTNNGDLIRVVLSGLVCAAPGWQKSWASWRNPGSKESWPRRKKPAVAAKDKTRARQFQCLHYGHL